MAKDIPQPEASTSPESIEPVSTLKEKRIWIIDDAFSAALSNSKLEDYKDDDTLKGVRPIDRGTLISLVKEDSWGSETAVKELCAEIIKYSENVLAFIHPISALEFISRYELLPDAIVYDLEYQNLPSGTDSLNYLKRILDECTSMVQVYAKQAEGEPDQLTQLLSDYPTRLLPGKPKERTTAFEISNILSAKLEESLSAKISTKLRTASQAAIEKVLVSMDDLPLNLIIEVIAKMSEDPMDQDLVDLISEKVGRAIRSSTELREIITDYAGQRNLPGDTIETFVEEIISNIASNLRDRIQYEDWLYKLISSAWPRARDKAKAKDDHEKLKVQEFFAHRLYDHPNDKLVRTGDIIIPVGARAIPYHEDGDLYLILTPPCDLVRFFKKTRGVLTIIKLHPLKQRGIKRITTFGNTKEVGESITTKPPVTYLPSIKKNGDGDKDYCLFAHEVTNVTCDKPDGFSQTFPLVYTLENFNFERICKVSEPFLSGILSSIEGSLFRVGVPNMPSSETDRLKTQEPD